MGKYGVIMDGSYILGMNLPWKTIKGEFCRVIHFNSFSAVTNGKTKKFMSRSVPYAILDMESPLLPPKTALPVTHKLDFHQLWEAFEERGITEDEEVLVTYSPYHHGVSWKWLTLPRFQFFIFPKGHLEEIYTPDFEPPSASKWLTPIARWPS